MPATKLSSGSTNELTLRVPRPLPASEWPRRAHAKLAERFDPLRVRHKPLSILRQEGRKFLEQLFELEGTHLAKPERDRLIEEILSQALGFGLLEELFRDDSVKEILVLDPKQIITRKNDAWMPTSVRFRDLVQYRSCLELWRDLGTDCSGLAAGAGGWDVKLSNGFRLMAILPPDVMEQAPQALFVRLPPETSKHGSSIVTLSTASPPSPPPTAATARPSRSTGTSMAPAAAAAPAVSVALNATPTAASRIMPAPDLGGADPHARLKQRVATWLVQKCAAAGLYDLSQIPASELQKVIQAQLVEISTAERLQLDPTVIDRLVLEILVLMQPA